MLNLQVLSQGLKELQRDAQKTSKRAKTAAKPVELAQNR